MHVYWCPLWYRTNSAYIIISRKRYLSGAFSDSAANPCIWKLPPQPIILQWLQSCSTDMNSLKIILLSGLVMWIPSEEQVSGLQTFGSNGANLAHKDSFRCVFVREWCFWLGVGGGSSPPFFLGWKPLMDACSSRICAHVLSSSDHKIYMCDTHWASAPCKYAMQAQSWHQHLSNQINNNCRTCRGYVSNYTTQLKRFSSKILCSVIMPGSMRARRPTKYYIVHYMIQTHWEPWTLWYRLHYITRYRFSKMAYCYVVISGLIVVMVQTSYSPATSAKSASPKWANSSWKMSTLRACLSTLRSGTKGGGLSGRAPNLPSALPSRVYCGRKQTVG